MSKENVLDAFCDYLLTRDVSRITQETYWSDAATAFRCYLSEIDFPMIEGMMTDASRARGAWDLLRTVIEDTEVPHDGSGKRSSQVNIFDAFEERTQDLRISEEGKTQLWNGLGAIVRAVLRSIENAVFEESLIRNHYAGNYKTSLNHLRHTAEE
jgi:hypothetical protein